MNTQTVDCTTQDAPPDRIAVDPCPALAELAQELAGTIVPTMISPDDCAQMHDWAARRCVVRWPDGMAVLLNIDEMKIYARPVWPDVMAVRDTAPSSTPPRLEPARWSPPFVAGVQTVGVGMDRPAKAQARDIVRRLLLPLEKAWPSIMEQHEQSMQYGRETLRAA